MPRRTAGYSLMELLIVIAIVGVLAGAAIASAAGGSGERLRAAAEMIAADLAYCRSLAVTYNSKYVATFYANDNRYTITHSGTDATLNVLPRSVFTDNDDPPTAHDVDLDDSPGLLGQVRLAGARTGGSSPANVTTIEFGPLGQTTRSEKTLVWLMMGSGDARRFLSIGIDPVTGLARIGDIQAAPPGGLTLPAAVVGGGS